MKKRRIKIYGERNTGTNYLQKLLRRNLQAEFLPGAVPRLVHEWFRGTEPPKDLYFALTYRRNLGWKHVLVEEPRRIRRRSVYSDDLVFVTLTKNPYSWLLSLYRRPYHIRGRSTTFEEFLVSRWRPVLRERLEGHRPDPIELWNLKNAAFISLAKGADCENLRYEDLLADPPSTVARIAERYGFVRVKESFANVKESTKRDQGRDFAYYTDYYLKEQWRSKLSGEALEVINARLNWEVAEAFGYSRISPPGSSA